MFTSESGTHLCDIGCPCASNAAALFREVYGRPDVVRIFNLPEFIDCHFSPAL